MNNYESSVDFRDLNRKQSLTKNSFVCLELRDKKTYDTAHLDLEAFVVSMKGAARASEELSVLMTVTKHVIRLLAKTHAAASH